MEGKPWSEMTEEQIDRIRRKRCVKCKYSAGENERTKKRWLRKTTCDYILLTGKRRGVRPDECEYWREK